MICSGSSDISLRYSESHLGANCADLCVGLWKMRNGPKMDSVGDGPKIIMLSQSKFTIHPPLFMLTRWVSEGLTGSGQAPRLPFARLYKPPATPSTGSRNVMKPISYAHRPQASWLAREQSCLTADLERDELLHNAGSWSI